MASNEELSRLFYRFAGLLELKEADRFKIVAYQRASQKISAYGLSLREVYDQGGVEALEKISGIGESIAAKTEEYLRTGKVRELEKLEKQCSPLEVELLQVSGIGPKTARKLQRALKAKDAVSLKAKLEKEGEKFFGRKTVDSIIQKIEIFKKQSGRMLLPQADYLAREVIAHLKLDKSAKKITAVGSLRRFKETVGDIDLVLCSDQPAKTIEHFTSYGRTKEIVSKGRAKSTLVHQEGARIDLEILPEEKFGSLLQHFTGSKEHNIALRSYARSRGMSVSEHGVKMLKGAKRLIKCSNEEELYRLLGMDYIEPELRENRGEIESARQNSLPNLVKMSDIKGDLHIHSNYSDGEASIKEIVQKAVALGYQYVGVADHTVGLGIARGLSPERFKERESEIERARREFPRFKIFSSCEVNIKSDGSVDLPDETLSRFDFVTASVHWAFGQDRKTMTDRLVRAITNPHIDSLGHPTGRFLGKREPCEIDWERLFETCRRSGTLLEINAHPTRLDLPDALVFEAKKHRLKFVVSSDSHSIAQMENLFYGVATARRGWLEAKDLANCLPGGDLLK